MGINRAEIQTIFGDASADPSEKADRIIDAITDQNTIKYLWLILVIGLVAALFGV